ncbi:MAG: indole-3-glycerol phosphate synthase TrpC [Clostridiales Family XIII bacterium]|jgi:indole-3-glycerol phosphate synthase|nr:indole-3-glycerol phosphate synthase TrpC [Clostridiales Family XIII bacterium]
MGSDTILDEIAAYARVRVAEAKETGFPFEAALSAPGLSFICEVKKASPSKGVIAEDFPYLDIAAAYERAGASAISVLTEPKWFCGAAEYLREIAAAVQVPVLRKDFIVDEYQIYEAKALGAAAVLLIVSILTDAELLRFRERCDALGLSALVEAHDEAEVARAISAGARVVGVNNRDLRTFGVDPENSTRLRSRVPEGVLFVAESGVLGPGDIRALMPAKPDAVLVGEAMMRAGDKGAFLSLLREASDAA